MQALEALKAFYAKPLLVEAGLLRSVTHVEPLRSYSSGRHPAESTISMPNENPGSYSGASGGLTSRSLEGLCVASQRKIAERVCTWLAVGILEGSLLDLALGWVQ